ncbi:MAG TPA: hypothetical protein VFZ83_12510 [Acidimicrobiia bacterium]|nr:hypothetical protein [Acidimicrobiia bacterium]
MVAGLAFLATAIATLFAQATLVRWTQGRAPHQGAWTVALAMYAAASAALATGESTGWDGGTYRVFYLFGAILVVPWLALGTVHLLVGPTAGRRVLLGLLVFSGLAAGVVLTTELTQPIATSGIPVGKEHFDAFPRVLAALGSGIGATVVLAGAVISVVRALRRRNEGRLAIANGLIALGVLLNSSGGLVQGVVGHDEAFTLALAAGVAAIYAGFSVATSGASARRTSLPAKLRGNDATTSTRLGSL